MLRIAEKYISSFMVKKTACLAILPFLRIQTCVSSLLIFEPENLIPSL